ncbi:MAG TPA: GNAT family N-acetyltransferase [Streptosporangiaceae bacterium]|jgi:GNAT superfamily N-acetyltransferase
MASPALIGAYRSMSLCQCGLRTREQSSPPTKRESDEESDRLARSLVEPLPAGQRTRLLEAMTTVARLLTGGLVAIEIEDPESADAQWCLESYFATLEERFEAGFDPDRSIRADVADLTPPGGLLLVARLHGRPVGCGALKLHGRRPAEIKRMWVAPEARGLGLGRRLLAELEHQAWSPWRATYTPGDQPRPAGGNLPLPLVRLCRRTRLQRRALRPPLVRKVPPGAKILHRLAANPDGLSERVPPRRSVWTSGGTMKYLMLGAITEAGQQLAGQG